MDRTSQQVSVGRNRPCLPKVKTGCRTCKTRKVKCDEAKPHCRRCTSTGRTCPGYPPRGELSRVSGVTSRSTNPHQPSMMDGMNVWLQSESEKRSFDYFVNHASHLLGGCFRVPFWSREVLQAAIYSPSIRHLVVALGAAYRRFESGGEGVDNDAIFALQQCNHSIRRLTQDNATNGMRSASPIANDAITASILLSVFAILQGEMMTAINHIRSGLKILQNLKFLSQPKSQSPSRLAAFYPIPITRMRSLLTVMYAQTRSMLSEEVSTTEWHEDPLVSDIECPAIYSSLTEVVEHVEALFNNTLAFFESNTARPPISPEECLAVRQKQDSLKHSLEGSRKALDDFILRKEQSKDSRLESSSEISMLRLYHSYLTVRLGVDVLQDDQREYAFDAFEPHFESMLENCTQILKATKMHDQPVCSFSLGVVMPLHMVAARCRDLATRNKAVALLLGSARREGLWDSVRVGRVAAMTVELEREQAALQQYGRVREVKIQDQSERGARLVFVVSTQSGTDQVEWHRSVEW